MCEILSESHADLRTLLEPPEIVELAHWHRRHVLVATLELVTRPAPAVQLRLASGVVLEAPDPNWPAGHRSFTELAADRAAFMAPPDLPAQEVHLDRVRRLRMDYLRELDRTAAYLRPHFAGWAVGEVRAHLARRAAAGQRQAG